MVLLAKEEGSSSAYSSSSLPFFSMMSMSPEIGSPYTFYREMKSDERGLWLFNLLTSCATRVAAGDFDNASTGLEKISLLVSPDGDIVQRIVAYFSEALADRVLKSWKPGLHKALNSTKMKSLDEFVQARKHFFEYCPFLRLAYVITNQAILEAMEGEMVVHIIDLNCSEPAQWINLLQELKLRREGPPHLRITGIHEVKEVLDQMAHRLNEAAERLDIPFQFHPIVSKIENLDIEILRVKTGEAVGVSSVLQLHSLLSFDDDNLHRNSPPMSRNGSSIHLQRALQMNPCTLGDFLQRDVISLHGSSPGSPSSSSSLSMPRNPKTLTFLNALSSLSPKLMVVSEQESNHNMLNWMERVNEALRYYAALFDCLDNTMPRAPIERRKIENMFGEEIKNIISCEGVERKVRHEKLEKWISKFEMSGFGRVPLSLNGMRLAKKMLQMSKYDGFDVKEINGCFMICWHQDPLFSVSSWTFRRQ